MISLRLAILTLDGDGYITGYAETEGVSFYATSLINPNYDPAIPYSEGNPDSWYVNPGNNCVDDGAFVGQMKSDLVFGPDTGFYCGYAYANVSANRASMSVSTHLLMLTTMSAMILKSTLML